MTVIVYNDKSVSPQLANYIKEFFKCRDIVYNWNGKDELKTHNLAFTRILPTQWSDHYKNPSRDMRRKITFLTMQQVQQLVEEQEKENGNV